MTNTLDWLTLVLHQIETRDLRNMGVTVSTSGEYTNSVDLLRPRLPEVAETKPGADK